MVQTFGGDIVSEAVIVALIAGVCSVIGQWFISRKNAQEKAVEDAVRDQKLEDRLRSVETKLDEHNGYAAKFAAFSTDIAVIKTKIENLQKGA